MRIVVVSDIHANLAALEAVLEAEGDRYDELWCLGDTVGYGARPNECAALIRERAALVLAGNHDLAVLGRVNVERFGGDPGRAARWTREVLDPDNEAWLAGLEPTAVRDAIQAVHGSPRDPVWEYIVDLPGAEIAIADAGDARVVLAGHTHVPMVVRSAAGRLTGGQAAPGREEHLDDEVRVFANPGSVGQPRDGDSRAAYLVLDLDGDGTARVEFRRVEYDIARTAEEIRTAGLPPQFADRLLFGM
jgi:diadenosine tetraphosphatase ApaH/serine/threonine PP2A family protein phosphatase